METSDCTKTVSLSLLIIFQQYLRYSAVKSSITLYNQHLILQDVKKFWIKIAHQPKRLKNSGASFVIFDKELIIHVGLGYANICLKSPIKKTVHFLADSTINMTKGQQRIMWRKPNGQSIKFWDWEKIF